MVEQEQILQRWEEDDCTSARWDAVFDLSMDQAELRAEMRASNQQRESQLAAVGPTDAVCRSASQEKARTANPAARVTNHVMRDTALVVVSLFHRTGDGGAAETYERVAA